MTVVNGIERDRNASSPTFTITNFAEDFDMDANGLVDVVADTLATLIRDIVRGVEKAKVNKIS